MFGFSPRKRPKLSHIRVSSRSISGFVASVVGGADVGYVELMALIVLVYLVLGMFMEPFGAMLVTLPVFMPVFDAQHIDMVWFGVLLVKLLEIGMITPPLGMNVFVIRNVASQYASLADVFRGILPFFVADLLLIAILVVFPGVVLFLPRMM